MANFTPNPVQFEMTAVHNPTLDASTDAPPAYGEIGGDPAFHDHLVRVGNTDFHLNKLVKNVRMLKNKCIHEYRRIGLSGRTPPQRIDSRVYTFARCDPYRKWEHVLSSWSPAQEETYDYLAERHNIPDLADPVLRRRSPGLGPRIDASSLTVEQLQTIFRLLREAFEEFGDPFVIDGPIRDVDVDNVWYWDVYGVDFPLLVALVQLAKVNEPMTDDSLDLAVQMRNSMAIVAQAMQEFAGLGSVVRGEEEHIETLETLLQLLEVNVAESSLLSVPGELHEALGNVNSTLPALKAAGVSIDQLAQNLNVRVDQLSSRFDEIFRVVHDTIKSFVPVPMISQVLGLICILFRMYETLVAPSKLRIMITLIEFFNLVGFKMNLIGSAVRWILSTNIQNQVEQGREVYYDAQTVAEGPMSLNQLLLTVLAVVACGAIPSADTFKSIVNYARAFNVFAVTSSTVAAVSEDFASVLPLCLKSVFCVVCPISLVKEAVLSGQFKSWIESVEQFDTTNMIEAMASSEEVRKSVDRMYDEGKLYYTHLVTKSVAKGDNKYSPVVKLWEKICRVKKISDVLSKRKSYRPRPFVVWVAGGPGVGKTGIAAKVAQVLAPPQISSSELIYSRNIADSFFSGYNGEWACWIDDGGQSVEGKDALEVIAMVGNQPYLPDMPALEPGPTGGAKGTPFTSQLLMITSNQEYPVSKAVVLPEAEWRRRDFVWRVNVRKEFQTPESMLNPLLLSQEDANLGAHLEWQRLNPTVQNQLIGKPMSTVDALVEMKKSLQKHMENQCKLLESFASNTLQDLVNAKLNKTEADVSESLDDGQGVRPHVDTVVAEVGALADAEVESWCRSRGVTGLLFKYGHVIALGLGALIVGLVTKAGLTALNSNNCTMQASSYAKDVLTSAVKTVKATTGFKHAKMENDLTVTPERTEMEVQFDRVRRNQCLLEAYNPETGMKRQAGVVLMLTGRLGVTNAHTFLDAEGKFVAPDQVFRAVVSKDGKESRYEMFRKHIKLVKTLGDDDDLRDLMYIEFPDHVPLFKDIRNMLISRTELNQVLSPTGALLVWRMTGRETAHVPFITNQSEALAYSQASFRFEGRSGYEYIVASEVGWCGAPLVITSGPLVGRVIGLHRSGSYRMFSPKRGQSEPLTREDAESALEVLRGWSDAPVLESVEKVVKPEGAPDLFEKDGIDFIGVLKGGHSLMVPNRTAIRPSPIFDEIFTHVKEPAALSMHDKRLEVPKSPLYESLKKQSHLDYVDDSPYFADIMEALRDEICMGDDSGCVRRVLTEDEAINGVLNAQHIEQLEMNTSAGFPYKVYEKGVGKKHLFEETVLEDGRKVYSVKSALLRARLDEGWSSWGQGKRYDNYVVDVLKDELRLIGKVRAGKTRTINVCSLDSLINMKRLFGGFVDFVMNNRSNTSYAVGMDPVKEWDSMARRSKTIGIDHGAGDVRNFDGSTPSRNYEEFAHIANAWYDDGPEMARRRLVAMADGKVSVHIVGGFVYQTYHALPTGWYLTAVFNSFNMNYWLRKAWSMCAPDEFKTQQYYNAWVRAKVYGDDNIVSRGVDAPWFTSDKISEALSTIGVEYTSADKLGAPKNGPLESITFLKNGFRRDSEIVPGVYYPTMDKETIQDLTNWVKKGQDPWEACESNCRDACRFAFFHGRDYFDDLKRKIIKAFADHGRTINLPTWAALRMEVQKDTFHFFTDYTNSNAITANAESDRQEVPEGSGTQPRAQGPTDTVTASDDAGQSNTTVPQKATESNTLGVKSSVQTTDVVVNRTATDVTTATFRHMPEIKWSLEDTAKKPAYLATLPWNIAGTMDTLVNPAAIWEIPWDVLPDATQSLGFNAYAFSRPSMKLTFSVQAQKFNVGILKVAYFPGLTKAMVTGANSKLANKSYLQVSGAFMSAPVSGTSSLIIPYTAIKTYINHFEGNQVDRNIIGTVCLVNVCPSGPAGDAPQIMVTSEYIDTNFAVLDPAALPNYSSRVLIEGILDMIPGISDIIDATTAVVKSIGSVRKKGQAIPRGPMRELDKPTIPMLDAPLSLRVPHYNFTKGIVNADKLTFDPSYQPLTDETIYSSTVDEATIENIARKYGWLADFTWSTSQGAGTPLMAIPVAPLQGGLIDVLDGYGVVPHVEKYPQWTANRVSLPPCDYLSVPFMFWSGGFIYKILIASSSFHTGQLFIAYYPSHADVPPATQGQRTARWFDKFELSAATQEVEFKVPFASETAFKQVPDGRLTTPAAPGYVSSPFNYMTGTVVIYCYTPLRGPPSVPVSVQCRVLKCAAEDFTLHYPAVYNRSLFPVTDTVGANNAAGPNWDQVYTTTEADTSEVSATEMANLKGADADSSSVGAIAPNPNVFNEGWKMMDFENKLTAMLKRYYVCAVSGGGSVLRDPNSQCNITLMQWNIGQLMAPFDASQPNDRPDRMYGLLQSWMSLFRFWKGGLRFRAHVLGLGQFSNQDRGWWRAYYIPGFVNIDIAGMASMGGFPNDFIGNKDFHSVPFTVAIANEQLFLDFEIPWVTLFDCLFTPATCYAGARNTVYDMEYSLGTIVITWTTRDSASTPTSNSLCTLFMSVADEFTMGGFIGTPSMGILNRWPDGYARPEADLNEVPARDDMVHNQRYYNVTPRWIVRADDLHRRVASGQDVGFLRPQFCQTCPDNECSLCKEHWNNQCLQTLVLWSFTLLCLTSLGLPSLHSGWYSACLTALLTFAFADVNKRLQWVDERATMLGFLFSVTCCGLWDCIMHLWDGPQAQYSVDSRLSEALF